MRLSLAILLAAAAASGCRSNSHLVERDLRERESEVRELRENLDQCGVYNKALQTELRAIRGEPFGPGAPEGPTMVYPIRSLTLGRQTGGRELDGSTGDAALQVVLEPKDAQNQAIKVPAAALIQAVEITPEGLQHPLSAWEVPPEQLCNYWRSGILTTGYVLVLPWKDPPTTEKMRVVTVLRLTDGRTFQADKDITIRLPAGMKKQVLPAPLPGPVPGDGPPLPAPVTTTEKPWWNVPPESGAALGKPTPVK